MKAVNGKRERTRRSNDERVGRYSYSAAKCTKKTANVRDDTSLGDGAVERHDVSVPSLLGDGGLGRLGGGGDEGSEDGGEGVHCEEVRV